MNRLVKTLLFAAFATVSSIYAQTCRADWSATQACLNISNLSGDTIVMPSNVTRINQNGLSLCPLQTSSSKIPAVIFVVDQSASMDSALGGYAAGDPLHWRAQLVRNAINYLYTATGGNGWFSYVEFANGVGDTAKIIPESADCIDGWNGTDSSLNSQDFTPLSLTNVTTWTSATGPIQPRCQSGTNYLAALTRAKEYAMNFDPGDVSAEVSVIYISDGYPNHPDAKATTAMAPLDVNYAAVPGVFPPVYGIFLGADASSDGDILAKISDSTGGNYNIVTPGDTAQMNTVMSSIIDLVSRYSAPTTVTLNVNGTAFTATSVKTTSGYQVNFPQTIPLVAGTNNLSLVVGYVDSTGIKRTKTSTFVIATTGAPVDTGVVASGEFFQAICATGNGMTINGLSNPSLVVGSTLATTPHLTSTGLTAFNLNMISIGFTSATATVTLRSARTGDVVDAILPAGVGTGQFTGQVVANAVASGLTGIPAAANKADAALSIAPFDTVFYRWINPADSRDSIVGSFLIYTPPTLAFTADTLSIDQISARVEDVGVANNGWAKVEYLWVSGQFVSNATLGRLDSSSVFQSTVNLKQLLMSALYNQLVVTYTDPIFGVTYTDTCELIFETPVLPVAWMEDTNGDGQADRLRLTYTENPGPDQHFPGYKLVWGDKNQDTTFFRVDSLNPNISFDVVNISQTAAGQQWVFDLPQPFPFAHTSGSGIMGQGKLFMTGWFLNKDVTREIEVVDKVGPVLTEFWLNPEELTLAYFRTSELLGTGASQNWILVNHAGNGVDAEAQTVETVYNEATGIYTLTLVDRGDNRIYSGDSVRFVVAANGGVRDLNGNGAHVDNPYVIVKGIRFPTNSINVSYTTTLIQDAPTVTLPATDIDLTNKFRVLTKDPATGDFTDPHTGDFIGKDDIRGMPALDISVFLPQLNGMDSTGNARNGMFVNDTMAWITTVVVHAYFFDQVGQFIAKKSANITINDTAGIRNDGTLHFSLLWQVDPARGLTDSKGRAVGTGVLLTKTEINMTSTAQVELTLYDETGAVSSNSIHAGDVIRKKRSMMASLGYLHK